MKKLLWLIPLFLAVPAIVGVVSAWSWILFGASLFGPWTADRLIACWALSMLALFSVPLVASV